MPKKKATGGASDHASVSCCRVESVITVDERGQMVLPKEVREKAGIRAGDKLALITWENGGRIGCISLMPVKDLAATVKDVLGSVMKDIL